MRKRRPIERTPEKSRDTTLVVIASEDQYAVKQYFELFHSTRVQFRVLETEGGLSAPALVLERLDAFMKEYEFGEGDEFWLVCDTDHWVESGHIHNLTQVVQLCRQKGIQVAMSNPCFDLWLLLHFSQFPENGLTNCDSVGALLRSTIGYYNKTKVYQLPITEEQVEVAIQRSAERPPQGDIPVDFYTAVHRIIGPLKQRFGITVVK